MQKALIIYDSGYGATEFTAQVIKNTLTERGLSADILPVSQKDLSSYDTIFIGSPIRLGRCTSKIRAFLRKNLEALEHKKIVIFFTCMSVTSNISKQEFPLYIDHKFNNHNKPKARLRIMENNHTASYYLKHFLKLIPGITPSSIAFFKGRLDIESLSLLHRLIMHLAMFSLPEIENGDFLRRDEIASWIKDEIDN